MGAGRSNARGAQTGAAGAAEGTLDSALDADVAGTASLAALLLQASDVTASRTHPRRAYTAVTVHCRAMRSVCLAVLAALFPLLAACGSSSNAGAPPPSADSGSDAGDDSPDPATFAVPPKSCAYTCPNVAACPESKTSYVCPSLGDWANIPHESSCEAWDGGFPAAKLGTCMASAPSGEAARYAGPDTASPGTTVLPDGRRITPAGSDWVFDEVDLQGGLTTFVGAIPGTTFVVTVDDGPVDHAVRVVDSTKIGSGNSPVTGYVKFAAPATLNSAAVFVPPDLVYVATNDGTIQALTVSTTSGTLAENDAQSITLPPGHDMVGNASTWYVAGLAVSPDGKRLVATSVFDSTLLVYDVDTTSTNFRAMLGEVDLGNSETFQVSFDPNDATGQYVYVSMWAAKQVLQVDVSNPGSPKVAHTYKTDMDPEGVAYLDARWMAVANDLGDTLSLVDRPGGTVTSVPIDASQPLHGTEPSTLAYDASSKRLYATWSGRNAVAAYDVDTTQTPPAITPAGELPSGWWPSGVVVESDGSLVVSEMRGHGTGPRPVYFTIGNSDIDARMRGGIQHIPAPSTSDLSSGAAAVANDDNPSMLSGAPVVTCAGGSGSDFPVPTTNSVGPSSKIQHVFFIVRENKGFDGVLGDLPGANGEPSYLLKQLKKDQDSIWHNLRALALTFTASDNYYTDAIYSTQGHVWATYGRTSDFNERTWAVSGSGRNARTIPGGGVIPVGQPVEGSLFDWLVTNKIEYNLLGEIVGSPQTDNQTPPAVDGKYPGGPFQNIGSNDLPKACYTAGRLRVLCNLGNFTYMTLPNDHTFGVSPTNPTPETFCAVNDEATGMIVDAITHSPLWASSIVFITEDDPSQGGEHVDSHRAPLLVISPWVHRGYVSHTHIDVASLHKLFAHIFGKPYRSAIVANAALPLDMFTSTPDFGGYTYTPRTWPLGCDAAATPQEKQLTETWDFTDPDEQPGLDSQVTRYMMGLSR
jgi:WD40 repeat protein